MARWAMVLALSGVLAGVAYMGRDWESEEEKNAIAGGVSWEFDLGGFKGG